MKKLKNILLFVLSAAVISSCKPQKQQAQAVSSALELSPADVTSIKNREIASWEFAKTKDAEKLKEILAEDYQAFFGKILMNKSEVIQSFQKTNITAYRLSNIRVKKISNDVAVIYYEALQNATDPDGEKWVPQIAASVIYTKRGAKWYSVFYHETPVMP
jgi:ketosteroid isomerase-like protein